MEADPIAPQGQQLRIREVKQVLKEKRMTAATQDECGSLRGSKGRDGYQSRGETKEL